MVAHRKLFCTEFPEQESGELPSNTNCNYVSYVKLPCLTADCRHNGQPTACGCCSVWHFCVPPPRPQVALRVFGVIIGNCLLSYPFVGRFAS
jgi:hypothetical protein